MNTVARYPEPLDGVSFRRVRYAPHTRQGRHHHDRTSLTLVFEGSLDEVVGATREQAGPLSVVFKPAGTEHENRIGPRGARTLQIEFEPEFLHGSDEGAESWSWAHGGPAARRFLALVRDLRSGDPGSLEAHLFDLLAGLRDDDVRSGPPTWLARVVEELEDTYRSPRSVRDLAANASVHPVALARAHRRHFGCSITERLHARRVREAAGRLGTDDSLCAVAYSAGFSDQSHMTRVFKRVTGVTPGAFRGLLNG